MSKQSLLGGKDLDQKEEEVKPPVCKILCGYLCAEKYRIFAGLLFLSISGLDTSPKPQNPVCVYVIDHLRVASRFNARCLCLWFWTTMFWMIRAALWTDLVVYDFWMRWLPPNFYPILKVLFSCVTAMVLSKLDLLWKPLSEKGSLVHPLFTLKALFLFVNIHRTS